MNGFYLLVVLEVSSLQTHITPPNFVLFSQMKKYRLKSIFSITFMLLHIKQMD